jgi:probable HAF family extracellular repeat protein
MKSRTLMCFSAITLFAALAVPIRLAAQDSQGHNDNHKLHHYKLTDVGTFGGPTGYLCNDPTGGGGACPVLNDRGTIVSAADTSLPNPNYPNICLVCPLDPYILHAFQWQDGSLTDLGALPGGYNSSANSISPNGMAVGYSENGAIDPLLGVPEVDGVLWKDGEIVNLGTIEGGYESDAFAVNDRGQVAGQFLNTIPDPFSPFGLQVRSFLWQEGVMQDLGTLGGPEAAAFFMNERGQVAGNSFTNTTPNPVTGLPTQDPFLWENGKMTDLGTLGGTFGFPNDLNNRGQVVGQSNLADDVNAHAFLWDKGVLTDLGTLAGASPPSSTASWISDAGEIVGGSYTPNAFHAFLWRRGVMTDLGTVDGDLCSGSLGINSETQVVGFSSVDCAVNSHAFLWEDGQIIDLNIFNHPGSGLQQLLLAYNINDRGEIDGLGVPPGVNPGDVFTLGHVFVLIPCDENHPGVEGCDYSLVDATALPQIPVSPAASRSPGQPFQLPRTRSPFRNRILGRILVKSETGEAAVAQPLSGNTGDLLPDTLDGLGRLCFICCHGCSGTGYCTLDSNNKLTGTCFGPLLGSRQCASKSQPVQCPVGKPAIRPSNFSCSIGGVGRVDAARSCTD